MSDPKYVRTSELAEHFDVSASTIMSMMKTGEIPANAYVRMGRVFRFNLKLVEEALLSTADKPVEDDVQLSLDFENDINDNDNSYGEYE